MKNRPGTNNVKNKPGTINEPGAWRFAAPSPTALSGESPVALFGRAAGLHQSGQLDLAGPLYRELLALQPENGDALHLLGVLLYQQRDPAAAVRLIEAALQFIPGNIFAWVGLGLALLRESPMWPEADWIQVGPAGAQTSFTLVNWIDSMRAGSISGIVLETPDVDADYAELTARGVACTPIESQPWGRWTTVKDPDGNEFVIQTSAAS